MLGLEPKGTWIKHRNPLKKYGVTTRWNIKLSHCNNGLGGEIQPPSFYRLRPAIIVVRHPAKWISSRFRKIPAERNLELEEFVMNEALDFFIDYSNEIYSCIGQSNKLFLSYKKLYEEQFLHSQPSWAAMMRFLFTSVDVDILRKSINNNIADGENSDLVQRYFNTKPSGLLQLTDVESLISKMISGELKSRLSPKVLNFFIANNYT